MKTSFVALPVSALLALSVCGYLLSAPPPGVVIPSGSPDNEIADWNPDWSGPLEAVAPSHVLELPPSLADEPDKKLKRELTCPDGDVEFEGYESPAAEGEGVVSMVRKGARADSPSFAMVSLVNGDPPARGSKVVFVNARSEPICRGEVVKLYHENDDESAPIEEIGLKILDESSSNPVAKGDRVCWPAGTFVMHGYWCAKFEDGTIACEGNYEHGKRTGAWSYWYQNGRMRAQGSFAEDKPVGTWSFWHEDGGRWAEWVEGAVRAWTIWSRDGQLQETLSADVAHYYSPSVDPEQQKILRALQARHVDVDYAGESLRSVIADLQRRAGCSLRLDKAADDVSGESPVYFSAKDTPVGDVLRATVENAGLRLACRYGVLFVVDTSCDWDEECILIFTEPLPDLPPSVFPEPPSPRLMYPPAKARDPNEP